MVFIKTCRADLQDIADLTFVMLKLNYNRNAVVLFPYVLSAS